MRPYHRGLCLALLPLALPASAEPTRPARELAVPEAGWVRVALDADAQALVPPGGRLAVLDPRGEEIPCFRLSPRQGRVPLALVGSEESADGWRLVFDAGVVPLVHSRLEAIPSRETTAVVTLEGSDDRVRWAFLARGTLARLGEGAGLARTAIDYPDAAHRFLRLSWPRGAGFPALEQAAVVVSETAPLSGPQAAGTVAPHAGDGAWRIDLPAAGLAVERIALDGVGLAGTALRLFAARDGRWHPLASVGACAAERCVVDLPREPLPSAALRAVVEPAEDVRLDSASLSLVPAWLLFEAPADGWFLVAPAAEEEAVPRAPDAIEGSVRDLPLGGPARAPLPPLGPEALELAPAGRLPRGWISWPVRGDGISAGEIARIEVTDAILDQPGVRADGLRPMVGTSVVPFAARILPEPGAGESAAAAGDRVVLELRRGPTAVAQLEVSAPGSDCAGTLEATWVRERRAGVEERRLAGTATWTAGEPGAGPCLALIDVAVPDLAVRIEVAAREGGTPPEAVRAWRARRELRFAWPDPVGEAGEAREVRLASGFDPLLESAPRVVSVRRQLAVRPAREVRVDLEATVAEIGATVRRTRLALWGALVVAAVVLLVVLGRGLSRRST